MSNSPLVTYTLISPNKYAPRKYPIDRITPHCYVGQVTAQRGCEGFAKPSRGASCNYVVGFDGGVGLCVDEKDCSWCSSDQEGNDHRAVTIETACDNFYPYAVTDAAYAKLIELCADICKRNGKTKILWFGDKAKTLAYKPAPDEMLFTVHRWFGATACPGDWIYSRMGEIAAAVNAKLAETAIKDKEEDDMVYYETREEVPEYYRPTIDKLIEAKALKGTGSGLHVSEDMCRILTILDRMGKL